MNIILLSVLAAGAISSIGVTPDVMASANVDFSHIHEKVDIDLEAETKLYTPTFHTGTHQVSTSYRDLFSIGGSRYRYYKEEQIYCSEVDPIYWPYLEVTGYNDESGAEFDEIEVTFDSMKGAFVILAEGYGDYCDGSINVSYKYSDPKMPYGVMSIDAYDTNELFHVYQNVWGFSKEVQIEGIDSLYWPEVEITSYVDGSGADFPQIDVSFDQTTGIISVYATTVNRYLDGEIYVYYRYENIITGSIDVEANYTWELKEFEDFNGSYFLFEKESPMIDVDSIYWPNVEYTYCLDNSGSDFYEYDVTFDSSRGVFTVFAKTHNEYLDGYITVNFKYYPDRPVGTPITNPAQTDDDDYLFDDVDDSVFENATVEYAEFTDGDNEAIPLLQRYSADNMQNAHPVTQSGKIVGKLEKCRIENSNIYVIDNDWFKFQVTENAKYFFNFQSPNNAAYTFEIGKYRGPSNMETVYSKKGSSSRNIRLTVGTYYLHVTASNRLYVNNLLYTINYRRVSVRNDKFYLKDSFKQHFDMCVWKNDASPDSINNRWGNTSSTICRIEGDNQTGYIDPYFVTNGQTYLDSVLYIWNEMALNHIQSIAAGISQLVSSEYDRQDVIRYDEIKTQYNNNVRNYVISLKNGLQSFIPVAFGGYGYGATGEQLMRDATGLVETLMNGINTSFPRLKTAGEFCDYMSTLETAAYYCRYYHGTMAIPRYAKINVNANSTTGITYSWVSYNIDQNYKYRDYFHYTNTCISQYQTMTNINNGQTKTFHGSLMPLKGKKDISKLFNINASIY